MISDEKKRNQVSQLDAVIIMIIIINTTIYMAQ